MGEAFNMGYKTSQKCSAYHNNESGIVRGV